MQTRTSPLKTWSATESVAEAVAHHSRLARIDGLRAVAVLAVICFHHQIGTTFGWVGVDLFFVLSGFLITSILMQNSEEKGYWEVFYTKRAARILPPLLVMIAAVLLLGHHQSIVGVLGCLFFLGNFVVVSRYSVGLLLVLWSLAVEEHFYIVWPFLTRRTSLRTLTTIVLSMLLVEPILRLAAMYAHITPEQIYYLTPFRLDGLLFGAGLAIMDVSGFGKEIMMRFGGIFALILWTGIFTAMTVFPSFQQISPAIPFNTFGYSFVALASFATVGYIAWNANNFVSRFLSLRVVSFIGEISYGMYLFHPLVISVVRHLLHIPPGDPGRASLQKILLPDLLLTAAFAYLSFRFVEKPCLKWAKKRVTSMRLGESVQGRSLSRRES